MSTLSIREKTWGVLSHCVPSSQVSFLTALVLLTLSRATQGHCKGSMRLTSNITGVVGSCLLFSAGFKSLKSNFAYVRVIVKYFRNDVLIRGAQGILIGPRSHYNPLPLNNHHRYGIYRVNGDPQDKCTFIPEENIQWNERGGVTVLGVDEIGIKHLFFYEDKGIRFEPVYVIELQDTTSDKAIQDVEDSIIQHDLTIISQESLGNGTQYTYRFFRRLP